jgi:hypothetical protein
MLLGVAFNLLDGPGGSFVRIFAGVHLGPPLAQQVPALVKALFHFAQAGPDLVRVRPRVRGLGPVPKIVLFLDERLDTLQKVLVVHDVLFPQVAIFLRGLPPSAY